MKKRKSLILQLLKFPKVVDLQMKLNTAELKIEILEETIKDELYTIFMERLKDAVDLTKIKKENKNLRAKVKTLKALLKDDKE